MKKSLTIFLSCFCIYLLSNGQSVAISKPKSGGNGNYWDSQVDTVTTASTGTITRSDLKLKEVIVETNPNNGNFWFRVSGLDKETTATLFYMDGKQIRQLRVVNLQRQRVANLKTGIYLLHVPGFDTQRIVVTGIGNKLPVALPIMENDLKF